MAAPSPWCLVVSALLVTLVLIVAVDAIPPSTDHGIMSTKNNLPYPITIICNSDTETRPAHYTGKDHSLQFDFDTRKHLSWTCTFQTEGPDGTFILWKSAAAGGPGNLCLQVYHWRVDLILVMKLNVLFLQQRKPLLPLEHGATVPRRSGPLLVRPQVTHSLQLDLKLRLAVHSLQADHIRHPQLQLQ